MRRVLSIALLLALVFSAALIAGFWAAARLAPERVRLVAEQQLGRVLEGQVTLASLELARARTLPWLWLEARGARAVMKDDITILAGRVRARLDPLSLAFGRLGLADTELEDVIVLFPPDPSPGPPRDRVDRIVHPIEVTGRFLRKHPCAIPDLRVHGLTLMVTRDDRLGVLLEEGEGELRCEGIARSHARATLAARARHGAETFPADFTLTISREAAAADLRLEAVPLAPLLAILGMEVPLAGSATGTARLEARAEGFHQLDVDLRGHEVRGPIPGGKRDPWLDLALVHPHLTGQLVATPDALSLPAFALSDGPMHLAASGEVALPPAPSSLARLDASLAGLSVAEAQRVLAQLPAAVRGDAKDALSRVRAGRIEGVRAQLDGELEELGSVLERGILAEPGAVHLSARLAAATLRLAEDDLATGVDAHLDFLGDRLALGVTRGSYHGRPVPSLSLTLTGIGNLRSFEEFACHEPRPQPPLDGLPRLREWLGEERSDPEERSTLEWQSLDLELDWVSHPALLCSLEQVAGRLEPTPEGFRFETTRSVWAGLPLALSGRWRRGDPEAGKAPAVSMSLAVGPPFEGMSLDPPAETWLSGRFALAATRLGRWHVRGATGRAEAKGARLDLPGTRLALAPGGEIQGRVGLDLGVAEHLPFSAEAQFAGVDLADVWAAADIERGALGGTLYGAGAIEGELRPGLNPLGDARGLLAMHAREGKVNRKIPLMVAIALASDRFNPFGSREELPYDAIDVVARVKKGRLVFDSAQLHAETLRMGATGKGGAVDPYALQAVVGLFFFPGLDSLIERVPILNRVILGRNGNFVGAYFAITGNWGEPEATLIPIQTVATGPAGFLTEGIPDFVLGGIKQIQAVILPAGEGSEGGS